MPSDRHFGAPMKRLEDDALLRGQGRFVDDIDLPGALHAAFVRSPYAHARLGAIDATAARALPGVHAVLTASRPAATLAREPHPAARAQSGDPRAAHAVVARARRGGDGGRGGRRGAGDEPLCRGRRGSARAGGVRASAGRGRLPRGGSARRALGAQRHQGQYRRALRAVLRQRRRRVRARGAYRVRIVVAASRQRPRDRMPRVPRALRPGYRQAHALGRGPDAARPPPRQRASVRARSRADPRHQSRCRRRLRHQGELFRRGGGDRRLRAPLQAPGQVDRGPAREFSDRDAGARPVLGHGDRARPRGQDFGRARAAAARWRRLSAARHHHAAHHLDHRAGPLRPSRPIISR